MRLSLSWSLRIALVFGAFVAALIANLWLVPTSFSVEATTEIVRLDLSATSQFGWSFDNVSIVTALGQAATEPAAGTYRPAGDVTLLVERISNGPLLIRCEASKPIGSCGEFRTRVESKILGPDVSFVVNGSAAAEKTPKMPVVLPFEAHAELGNRLDLSGEAADPAMLLKARIRMLGRPFIGEGLFDGGTIEAGAGDYLDVDGEQGSGVGFIRVSTDDGMTVAYRVVGRSISVMRLRSRGYRASTSMYARVTQDASLQVLWAATLAFCALFRDVSKPIRKALQAATAQEIVLRTSDVPEPAIPPLPKGERGNAHT